MISLQYIYEIQMFEALEWWQKILKENPGMKYLKYTCMHRNCITGLTSSQVFFSGKT